MDSEGKAIDVYPNTGFDSCSSPTTELQLPDRAPTLDSPKALVVQGEHVKTSSWTSQQQPAEQGSGPPGSDRGVPVRGASDRVVGWREPVVPN